MITTVDMLGPYRFRHWLGAAPPRPQQQVQVMTYPGVNYQAHRLLGLRTRPFQRVSVVDVASIAEARLLYINYAGLIGQNSLRLIWQSWDMDMEGLRANVLNCEMIHIQQRVAICNALYAGNVIDLAVRWTLNFSRFG